MSDWGLNPATVQALGAVATTLALLGVVASVWYARRTSQEAKRSADAATDAIMLAEREGALRTRPWVGIAAVGPRVNSSDPDHIDNALLFRFDNVGSLPAGVTEIVITFEATDYTREPEEEDKVVRKVEHLTYILPGSHVDFPVGWNAHPQLKKWVAAGEIFLFDGTVAYKFGSDNYKTEFTGMFDFTEGRTPSQFRNTSAS